MKDRLTAAIQKTRRAIGRTRGTTGGVVLWAIDFRLSRLVVALNREHYSAEYRAALSNAAKYVRRTLIKSVFGQSERVN